MNATSPIATRLCVILGSCAMLGCASAPSAKVVTPETEVHRQIISTTEAGNERELFQRGEQALAEQRYADAKNAFETLLLGKPSAELIPKSLLHLANALEALGERERARDRYVEFIAKFPDHVLAKFALTQLLSIHVYLEAWKELFDVSEKLLAQPKLDGVEKLTGLGARGLARTELGDDMLAMRDVQNALDLVDELSYGKTGRLPPAASQIYFALGEVRRARSEKIRFVPEGTLPEKMAVPPDFLPKMEARCQGLLDAQSAYSDAMRSVDPHWIAMSGFRVGEMYRVLHHDLMMVPPTLQTKTDSDKQLFFAMMHVRYRVLLEKGLEMMKRTLVIGEKDLDASSWIKRAEASKKEIELAIEEERAIIKSFPYTEETVQRALDLLKKKADLAAEKRQQAIWDKEKPLEKGKK